MITTARYSYVEGMNRAVYILNGKQVIACVYRDPQTGEIGQIERAGMIVAGLTIYDAFVSKPDAGIMDRFAVAMGYLLDRFRAEGMTLEAMAEALGFELDAVEHEIDAEEGEEMSEDTEGAAKVRDLLNRLCRHLEENDDPVHRAANRSPEHHAHLLYEAEEMIEDLAMRCGLLQPPRTVSRKTDWDRVEATTEAEIARQIIEDAKE